ncbi:MAG: hypothetical protein FJ137_16700 [Deltaproteobacteria bacterium]|nr:hypothetical protein [Deltaproteobacteria bacterium]
MAELTIRFRHDKATGKRELVIHLESDDDVLGHEHERDHRRLVEQLIGQQLDDDVAIVVQRGEAAPAGTATTTTSTTTTTTPTAGAPRPATGQKG